MATQSSGKKKNHKPNHIPITTRLVHGSLSILLLSIGTCSILNGFIIMPTRHGKGHVVTGLPAYILYAAIVCASANLMSVVIDHYDKRNNETDYKSFARFTQVLGWSLVFLSLALEIIIGMMD